MNRFSTPVAFVTYFLLLITTSLQAQTLTLVEVHEDNASPETNGTPIAETHLNGVYAFAMSPDGNHLYVTSGSDDAVVVFNRNLGTGMLTLNDAITVFSSNVGLPVELVSFEGKADGSRVALGWRTSTETNNAGFEIQTRTDGQTWRGIGYVEGHGTTVEAQSYSFITEDLVPGRHQFRLRQIDLDGSVEFSGTIEVAIEVPGTHHLSEAYPNPFNPGTQFTLVMAKAQDVRFEVFDINGRRIKTLHQGMLAENTPYEVRFEADDLPGGLYVIRVMGENFVDTRQVTLVK